jgi:trigger factor
VAVTKEIKRLEKSNVKLSITVPKEDVRAQYQDMLNEYAKNMQLPGFRKGKVPQEVLERKFAEALKGDAMGRIVEAALEDYFKDENLPRNERPLPYSTPEIEDEPKFDLENDLQFSVVYDVLPEVKVGKWKGLSVEYPYAEIEKEDINRELDEIRERNAIVLDRDESAKAQKGDVVTIDYQVYEEDGETQSNLQRKDFAFTLGDNNNVFQFDDDIIGMKKSETKEFQKKFADDFFEPSLAGKTRKVQITLNSLKEKKLPDLDDDLAQDVDEKFKTLDDLKNSIKERLSKNLEWQLRDKKLNEVLKKIMEDTPVILPESMVRAEIEGRWRRLARYYNTSVEALMQVMTGENKREETEKEWRKGAEKALHSRLILETLMEEQKIEVTDEDVEKEFERIAGIGGDNVEDIKKNYNNEQAMFYLKEDIREQKITGILLAENTMKPGKKENYLDFMTDNG